jgi:threonyl-tRNA synthetase
LGTVQVDYNLPVRFDLNYTGADNKQHRPVMIHRAPFGSMERFIGVLIEHFAGTFPLWLAPEQGRILTVSNKAEGYAREVQEQMISAGLRITDDYRSEKLGAKIREGRFDLLPYLLIIGPRDAENGTVSIRDRYKGDLGAISVTEAIAMMVQEVADKTVRQHEQPDEPE